MYIFRLKTLKNIEPNIINQFNEDGFHQFLKIISFQIGSKKYSHM